MILIAASMLIVNQEVINQRIYTLIGTTLQDWVYKETKGLYKFSYDSLDVNTLREQVTLKNVELKLDSAKLATLDESEYPNSFYAIRSPNVFLDISSIWNVIFDNKLDFKNIKVDQPAITVFNVAKEDSAANLSFESGNLYLKLNKYLDEFNIEKFFLEGGNIVHLKQKNDEVREISINDLDVYVDNLVVDAEKKTAETDRIRVVLKKPSFMLADGIHKIQMDSLLIDSKYETILLTEVYVFPEYEKLKESNLNEINLYNFSIPSIHLKGIDFSQAYQDNILEINQIAIQDPEIIIDTHKKEVNKDKAPRSNSLPILLAQLFSRITTHELKIIDAKMDFAIEAKNKLRNITVKNTSISIMGLVLDTLEYNKKNSHIDYTQLSFRLEDYQLILPDSLHELTAGEIIYHSDSSKLHIRNVAVYPKNDQSDALNMFKIDVPEISLNGFRLKEYVQTHQIALNQINISQPKILIYQNKASKNDSISLSDFNFSLPDDRIAGNISSEEIFFEDITFNYLKNGQELISVTEGDLLFSNFVLNSRPVNPKRLFNSSLVYISLAKTNVHNENYDLIEFINLQGTLNNPTFNVAEARLQAKNGAWSFLGEIIKIGKLDLEKALANEDVFLDSLTIGSASFKINTNTPSTADKTKTNIKLGFLSLKEGKVSINNSKSITTEIQKISGYIKNIDLTGDDIKTGDFSLSTGPLSHIIEKEKLVIGAFSSTINSKNLLLHLPYIIPTDSTMDNAVTLKASQLGLVNYDPYLLLNEKTLITEELKILSTSFEIKNINSTKTEKNKDILYIDWQKALQDKLKEIKINRVIVSGPQLDLNLNGGQFATKAYQVELNQFNTMTDGRKHLLNSQNIRMKIAAISYLKNKLLLKADHFNLDENKKLIAVNNLSISNSSILLEVPLLFAKRLDLKKLAEEQKLIGNELEVAGYTLTYKIEGGEKKNKITKAGEEKVPLISFRRVNAHQGTIKLITKEEQVYSINNVRGQLTDFDTESNKSAPLYTKSIDVKASDLSGFFNQNNDKIIISGIHLQNSGKKLLFNQINITPIHEKLKYAYQFGYEKDWINAVIRNVEINDLNLKALLQNNKMLINRISAKSLTAEVYRDKKLPFPEDKKSALPQTALQNLKMDLDIDTVTVGNAKIKYQELSELAFEPGELIFSDLRIIITNITNIPERVNQNKNMQVRAVGDIENTDITANVNFDLSSENDEFRFTGKMGEGNLTRFNKIMEKNIFLRIDKGYSKGMTFNILANNEQAIGVMQFHYRNLKVSLLDKQTNKSSGLDESLASFFANTFVIKSNNPSFFVLKEGDIFFKRDKSKSLFNYWAKSFLSGVVSSIGVKNNKKEAAEAMESQD